MSVMDFSQVSLDIASATLAPHSDLMLDDVNMHPDHSGLLRYAILMGARIHILNQRWEKAVPVSKLRIQHAKQLIAVTVRPDHLHTLIQDLPALTMLAICAKGTTVVRGLSDPTPQVDAVLQVLQDVGAQIEYNEGSWVIPGLEKQGLAIAKSIYSRFKEFPS
jgi:3-phosphoshikimate 1-carboxyvinyltransferase